MWLWNAFSTWNYRATMAARARDNDNTRFCEALAAEESVGRVVSALGHLTENIHLRKRIPDREAKRNREIDVIAVADTLYVVEVKNWAGDVWSHGPRWFQLPPCANAHALEFNDVAQEVQEKADLLIRYLKEEHNVVVPPDCVKPVVVFSNDSCRLDPRSLGQKGNVMTIGALEQQIQRRSAVWDNVTYYIPALSSSGTLSGYLKSKISAALKSARTWDIVTLHNGTTKTGDVLGLVAKTAMLTIGRKDFENLTMKWSGESPWGLVVSLVCGSAGTLTVTFTDAKAHRMVLASQRHRSDKTNFPTINRDGTATIVVRKQNYKKVDECDHLSVRPAGKPHVELIPLATIKSISLSVRCDLHA